MDWTLKEEPSVGSIVITMDDNTAYQRAGDGWYSASPIRGTKPTPWHHLRDYGVILVLIGQN